MQSCSGWCFLQESRTKKSYKIPEFGRTSKVKPSDENWNECKILFDRFRLAHMHIVYKSSSLNISYSSIKRSSIKNDNLIKDNNQNISVPTETFKLSKLGKEN